MRPIFFIVPERVRRYAGRVGQLTDGHGCKLSAKRQRFDLDEKLRSKERGDLDQRAGWRVAGVEELIASSTECREVREVRDERRELDEVLRTCYPRPRARR
jgi:hypothetical protein